MSATTLNSPTLNPVCGFVGLGSQGGPIAQRMIDAGLPMVLWARRAETLEPYRATAARYADTLGELAGQVDHLGLCVVNDDDVRGVCGQVIPAMRAGSRIAIHSTIHPDTCREVAAQAAARGIKVLDAPVSGGGPAAQAGTLAVMVGGDAEELAAARPILETFGRPIIHLGDVGAGQQAKLINNTLFAAHLGMAHDALKAAAALGVAEDALVELMSAGSGQSFGLRVRARMPPPAKFRHPAELLAKDVRLLGEVLGPDHQAFLPLREAADEFLSFVLSAERDG
jgi:3-hydroxyisobutyrate dehydrogenase-like beta-hydroxyacid dehydrogenase